ncbi:MAG: DUF1585 domain-containing protein [Byssovorax sp.]
MKLSSTAPRGSLSNSLFTASRVAAIVLGVALLAPAPALASPSLEDYRHFRALAIDLLGRMPTRDEVAAFERPGFDLDGWIEKGLNGPGYAERLSRVYMDVLRLEVSPAFQFVPAATTLRRETLLGPDKQPVYVYYRQNQRRAREATDGEFCLTKAETGLQFPINQPPTGTATPVSKAALDAATVMVKPWWLYRDFQGSKPELLHGKEWEKADPAFSPIKELLLEPDGKTPTVEIRVCKEEAQTAAAGYIYLTGRPNPEKGAKNPFDRLRPLPVDDGYAKQHKGESLSCRSALGATMTIDCGCGVGLQYCTPGDGPGNDPRAFTLPTHVPLGLESPIGGAPQSTSAWYKLWWSEEAKHFFGRLFGEDRDFREVLTSRSTLVNGPLAQFYRAGARSSCCSREKAFGLAEEAEPLFNESALPEHLDPEDTATWKVVNDRGPHAAGLLTMPIFLAKYASRRARAAAVYTSFLCKQFVAEKAELTPSTEPNLMIRPGCASCHATLEPLAAYFSRVEETSWVFLPPKQFPAQNPVCKQNAQGKMPGFCDFFYDAAFSSKTIGMLRGAYASPAHAESGPAGVAQELVKSPEFAECAVERVASSFLDRPLGEDDAALKKALLASFIAGGYRMRPLVRALLHAPAYAGANNLASTTWRKAASP